METKTNRSMVPAYQIYFFCFGYSSSETPSTFKGAVDVAKKAGFEASIYEYGKLLATWCPIVGLRMFSEVL